MLTEYKIIRTEKLLRVNKGSVYTLEEVSIGIGSTLDAAIIDLQTNLKVEHYENKPNDVTTNASRDYAKHPLRPSASA